MAFCSAQEEKVYTWPDDWLGNWQGSLRLLKPGSDEARVFPMRLEIAQTEDSSRFNWTIIYGEGEEADVRKYELISQPDQAGHFIIDEKNSILLDQYLIGNTMVSRFAVDQTLLFVTYHLQGDRLFSQMASGPMENPRVSGLEIEEASVDSVRSYVMKGMQEAILTRQ